VRALRRLLGLTGAERRLALSALGLLAAVRCGLWLLPFRTLYRLAEAAGRARPPAGRLPVPRERVLWAVAATARFVPRPTCLVRALAARTLLARHGHPSELRLGVARGHGRAFEAHAWLEEDGRVLVGGPVDPRYVPLPPVATRR
jgi:hypothetical protein